MWLRYPSKIGKYYQANKPFVQDIVLILSVGLLSITWFKGNHIISSGDFTFPLGGKQFLENTLYLWDNDMATGYSASRQIAFLIPYSLLAAIFESLHLSMGVFEKTLFYFWFALSGLSAYLLCHELKINRIGKLSAAFFYMMNPYSLSIVWHLASGLLVGGYATFPLLLALYVSLLSEEKGYKFKSLIVFLLIWFFTTTYAYANPTVAAVHWTILFTYLFCFIFLNRDKLIVIKKSLVWTGLLFFIWLILNAFWLIPFVAEFTAQQMLASSSSLGFITDIETVKLNSTHILGSFRLTGVWDLLGEYRGVPYHSWGKTYFTFPFILLSFLVPFVAFIPLLQRKKPPFYYIFFACITILGIFLIKGLLPPLAFVNRWLYTHIPFILSAFRANIQKWGLLLSVAFVPLMGYGTDFIYKWLRVRRGSQKAILFIGGFFFLLYGVYNYPFWNGEVIFSGGKNFPGARFQIPSYYNEAKNWIVADNEEHRIFSLPISRNANTAYLWERNEETYDEQNGYAGGDFIRWFSNKPVLAHNIGPSFDIMTLIAEEIEKIEHKQNLSFNPVPLFSILNVRYLLFHKDFYWDFWKGHPWQFNHTYPKVNNFIDSLSGVSKNRNFGKLSFYRLADEYFLPKIYPTLP